jgi:hypothetical protein
VVGGEPRRGTRRHRAAFVSGGDQRDGSQAPGGRHGLRRRTSTASTISIPFWSTKLYVNGGHDNLPAFSRSRTSRRIRTENVITDADTVFNGVSFHGSRTRRSNIQAIFVEAVVLHEIGHYRVESLSRRRATCSWWAIAA